MRVSHPRRTACTVALLLVAALPGLAPAGAVMPNEVTTALSRPVARISAGARHTCAVTVDGDAWCWGSNSSGQLGDGSTVDRSRPVRVHPGQGLRRGGVVDVATGLQHTCALTDDGHVYCWGFNGQGELGDGTSTTRSTPVAVSTAGGLTPGTVARLTAGQSHSCAIDTGGDAYCWGWNLFGQLGDGTTTTRRFPKPVSVGTGLAAGTVAGVSAGMWHTCAVTTGADTYCWGSDSNAQLGNGAATSSTTPVAVDTGSGLPSGTVLAVTAGNVHTCAVTSAQAAHCWGANLDGSLGDGTTTVRTSPVAVASGSGLTPGSVAHVTAGGNHSCATTGAGDAYCWGGNTAGQLGDGTTSDRTTATPVSAGAGLSPGTVAHIDTGGTHTCAVTFEAEAYCWGFNGSGRLGDGTTTERHSPVRVVFFDVVSAAGEVVLEGMATLPRFPCPPPPPFGDGPCEGSLTGQWTGELVGTRLTDDPEPFQVTWTSQPDGLAASFTYAEWDCTDDLATVLGIAEGSGTAVSGPGQVDGRWVVPGEPFPRAVNAVAMDFTFTWTRVLTGALITLTPRALRLDVAGIGWQVVITGEQRAVALFAPVPTDPPPHVPTCEDPLRDVTGPLSAAVPVADA